MPSAALQWFCLGYSCDFILKDDPWLILCRVSPKTRQVFLGLKFYITYAIKMTSLGNSAER